METVGGFGSAILVFSIVMCLGFLTFGGASSGLILNNYASADKLATIARFCIGIAMVTGFPFVFAATRDGILDLKELKGTKRENATKKLNVVMMSLVIGLALIFKDVGLVIGISGALFGCPLMLSAPAFMNINAIKDAAKQLGRKLTSKEKLEIGINWGLFGMGGVTAVLGVAVSVLRQVGKL